MSAFNVVRQFEEAVAKFSGSRYCVAVNSGTSALFLAMKLCRKQFPHCDYLELPAHTFVSVPMAAIEAGYKVDFSYWGWNGAYRVSPLPVFDGALRFQRGMYLGGMHCLSFQARKILNIGEGGAVLTDSKSDYEWLRRASYCGRGEPGYRVQDITEHGYNCYMTPEKAARGLHLMEYIGDGEEDQKVSYPDLREVPYFNELRQRRTLRAA